MAKFDDFFDLLKGNLGDLLRDSWADFFSATEEMGTTFLETIKDDLDKWTQALTNGELPGDEFLFLVESKKELMKLQLLTEAGLTKVRIEKLQNAIIEITVKTALDVFL